MQGLYLILIKIFKYKVLWQMKLERVMTLKKKLTAHNFAHQ